MKAALNHGGAKMNSRTKTCFPVCLIVLCSLVLLASCGGGGGSGGSFSTGASGSVALYIKDAPADDYENIYIYIEEVSLIPADEAQSPVIIFKSSDPDGYEIDLLDLRDQDMLLTIKSEVAAGLYEKIRLKIKDIYPIPKPDAIDACDRANMEIKLPSGKIDLNPQGGINIQTGRTLSIRLDIDANKSIQIHPAGNSGKCIFRPVVFVNIEPVNEKPQIGCLRLLKGTIGELLYRDQNIVGFILDLPGDRGRMNVYVSNAVIFDENGLPIPEQDLGSKGGMAVSVRGELDEAARFQADLIILGQVLAVKGIVGDRVDQNLQFPLAVVPGQEFIGSVTVVLSDESLILTGCDQTVDPSYVQKDMVARVIGKYDTEKQLFQAVAVFLQPVQVIGTLDAIHIDNGIKTITVRTESGSTVEIVQPQNVLPMLEGDGIIPDVVFECAIGKLIRVMLDPDKPLVMTALEVRVQPDTINAVVKDVSAWGGYESTIVALDSQDSELTIKVMPTATILKSSSDPPLGDLLTPIALDDISMDDRIRIFAIPSCNDAAADYIAFIILDYLSSP